MNNLITQPSLASHNGVISLQYQQMVHVFRVHTRKDGTRIVETRAGSKHWWPVGNLDNNGKVVLSGWKSRDWESQERARLLNNLTSLEGLKLIAFTGKCRRCNRDLIDPVSRAMGIGPICAQKEKEFQTTPYEDSPPASPIIPPAEEPVKTYKFSELCALLTDDQMKQAYGDSVDHHNAIFDDLTADDRLVAQSGRASRLIWKQMEGREGLEEYYGYVSPNHTDCISTLPPAEV